MSAMRVAAVLAAMFAAGSAGAQRLWSDPPFAYAPGRFAPAAGQDRRYACISILAAVPYGIEDLSASRLEIGAGTASLASGVSWRRLAHPLYREDLVAALAEARLPAAGLRFGAMPLVAVRAAKGFDGERSFDLFAAVAWVPSRSISLRAGIPADGRRAVARRRLWLVASARVGTILAGVLAHSPDGISRETRVFAAADLGRGAAVESSYAVLAREVSGAFAFERHGFLISIAWSVHPALGVGVSAEVGREWVW